MAPSADQGMIDGRLRGQNVRTKATRLSALHPLFDNVQVHVVATDGMADDDVAPVQPCQGLIRYAGVVKQQVVKLAEGGLRRSRSRHRN